MKYLINYKRYGNLENKIYSFKELKQECVKLLDCRGWDNKKDVDLRSYTSMAEYLYKGEILNILKING